MRRGFGFHDRHSPFRFNPETLFVGGAVQGALYDPSDLATLFQDSTGLTPVTAAGQAVGLMLDKSKSVPLVFGSTIVTNGTFDTNLNGWTVSRTATASLPVWSAGAMKLVSDGSGFSIADQALTTVAGVRYRFSLFVTYPGAGAVEVRVGTTQGGVDLLANQTIAGGGTFSYTFTATGTTSWVRIRTGSINATGYLVDNVSVQAFPAGNHAFQTSAASCPLWQQAGGLSYLAFDGSNDSMLTNSINFTATNKMTVCAGLLKSSDAAQGVVAELSATIASNNGAFLLSAPNSAAANYNWSSKGTTQVDNTVTTYTAPHTAVLTGQADIAAPSNIIRVNGAQAGSVATTQGTGNYGNYPLYIGRRNNASLPFNGRLYGLIVLGAAASDWQVYVTEQWMAGKTGLQF